MKRGQHRRPHRRFAASAVLLSALVALAVSVGSASSMSQRAATRSSTAANLKYVNAQVAKFKKAPPFPKLPAVNAKKAAGKRVALIPFSTGVPFIAQATKQIGVALGLAGVKSTLFPSQGQLSQVQQAFSTAIGQKYNAIDLFSINAAVVGPQLIAAKRAGIPVVGGHVDPTGAPLPKNQSAHTPAPFYEAGRLEADYVISHSKGHARTLIITSNEQTPAKGTVAAIQDEFKKYCGASCSSTVVNVPIADWATKMQSQVQSSLLADPKINYIIQLYDSGVQFILPGITAAHAQNRVKIVTFNGTDFVLKYIQTGNIVIADVGEDTTWLGWAIADETFRLLTGAKPVADEHTPLRIFDKSNVAQTGTPPKLGAGYGNAYITGYKKTWGVG